MLSLKIVEKKWKKKRKVVFGVKEIFSVLTDALHVAYFLYAVITLKIVNNSSHQNFFKHSVTP